MNGYLAGGLLIVSPDGSGLPVRETEAPQIPDGYKATASWSGTDTEIVQTWALEPIAGTAQDAAIGLARMLAVSLSDEDALKVAALYPEWWAGAESYASGNRVLYRGVLYKCRQAHKPQADWAPDAATSLWAEVLAGQDGTEIGEWAQPDSTNPYMKGDRVTHDGKTWESKVDNNTWEPGAVGTASVWVEVAA